MTKTNTPTLSTNEAGETKSGKLRIPARILWPGMVVAFLGMQLIMCGIALVLANGSAAPVVVQNYHQRALEWDAQQASLRHSADMQWQVVWQIEPELDALNRRRLRIDIIDVDHQPVQGAVAEVLLFHHALAHDSQRFALTESTPGCYTALIRAPRSGLWDMSLKLKHADDDFVFNETKEIKFDDRTSPRMLPR